MALQIGRGFFRLWIVLSVLWVCTVGAVTWSKFPIEGESIADIGATKAPVQTRTNMTFSEMQALVRKETSQVAARERWEIVQAAVKSAIVPPIFILVLGLSLGWAMKGFRN